jgi:hypothetical protein
VRGVEEIHPPTHQRAYREIGSASLDLAATAANIELESSAERGARAALFTFPRSIPRPEEQCHVAAHRALAVRMHQVVILLQPSSESQEPLGERQEPLGERQQPLGEW